MPLEEGEKWTVATATARREVEDLEAIDTILASPAGVRWVNLLKGVSSSCEVQLMVVVLMVRQY